jgi:hypothetical protein
MLPMPRFFFFLNKRRGLISLMHTTWLAMVSHKPQPATCSRPIFSSFPAPFPVPSYAFPHDLQTLYQIPGTMANFLALYFPPNSFLYLRSFFLAQTAICPTAMAMKSAVLQCLLTIKIAIQAIDSKV